MTKEEIYEELVRVFVDSFELERAALVPTAHLFDDLDLDSIDAIDLMIGLEERTGLKVREEEFRDVRTVQDVVDLIYGKLPNS